VFAGWSNPLRPPTAWDERAAPIATPNGSRAVLRALWGTEQSTRSALHRPESDLSPPGNCCDLYWPFLQLAAGAGVPAAGMGFAMGLT
jgi:hypothetical protein